MTRLLSLPDFANSELGRAEAERSLKRGAKRPDLLLFDRVDHEKVLVSGELKAPWTAEGKTPFDADLVLAAYSKAGQVGARYFITWNIRRAVVWKTDNDGVPLNERAVYDREIFTGSLRSSADLTSSSFKLAFEKGIRELLSDLAEIVAGRLGVSYLPLDRLFVARLESMLDHINDRLVPALLDAMRSTSTLNLRIQQWMRTQSWPVSDQTREENAERAVRFSSYVLLNRMCFYNALRRKYPSMPQLRISTANKTGPQLRQRLSQFFDTARRVTNDYETVFTESDADQIPFLSDECVGDWRNVVASLDKYDFAKIDFEVIGAMYEQLIRPEERHRFGQHYTQPVIVDLINSFSIRTGDDVVLDPACGGGTFLVRAYSRRRFLDPSLTHDEQLATLYGCDILSYACHLSVINLAIRDLVDEQNFPQVRLGDYLDIDPTNPFCVQPISLAAGGLKIEEKKVYLNTGSVDAVIGNPPYIASRLMASDQKQRYLSKFGVEFNQYSWGSSSDILIWFWVNSLKFLRRGGRLSLITQAAWLDVEYGFPLQEWMLDHFRIVAIMESEAEPWFTDARVATVVAILEEESVKQLRDSNEVRFVQFRRPLAALMGTAGEALRHAAADKIRDELLGETASVSKPAYRIRIVSQNDLRRDGLGADGQYDGGKWGRHLRALDSVYNLQRRLPRRFCALADLAVVDRGSTTNCDDFFIVRDVTERELAILDDPQFKAIYGFYHAEVMKRGYRVVARADGTRFILHISNLRPILKSARDVFERTTSALHNEHFAVIITHDRRQLTKLEEAYVQGGEREDWHLKASFAGRSDWYKLRNIVPAQIYFVKTIQYAPQLLWNDANLLANQRLYGIRVKPGVDAELLAGALSGTIFAAERFTGAKALGREAANDVEVFTARKMQVFDIRTLGLEDANKIRESFRRLRTRRVRPILEQELIDARLASAQAYVDKTPVSTYILPEELRDEDRVKIDRVLLKALGIADSDLDGALTELYVELTAYQRKARLLELSAQLNRRGAATGGRPTPSSIADEIIASLLDGGITKRNVPAAFIPAGVATESVQIPSAGKPQVERQTLFSIGQYAIRFGHDMVVSFAAEAQMKLALLLSEVGIRGEIELPVDDKACEAITAEIEVYFDDMRARIEDKALEVSDDEALREKVVSAAMKELVTNNKPLIPSEGH